MYLNHASAGVLPERTRAKLVELVDAHAHRGLLGFLPVELDLAGHRERIAAFIGADGDDVAFLRNTTDGANTIARGLSWQAGDEIVVCDNEFGANVFPYVALRELGVVVTFVRTAQERLTPEVLARVMTPRTRLVAVSWVGFFDGYRHDVPALAEVAHARGAFFVLDAIQALGAFPFDVRDSGVDALYAGGNKWLMALPGVSLLWVAPALRAELAVRWHGWRAVADIWNFLDYDQPLAQGASRFEGGTQNFLGIAALERSTSALAEAGPARIGEHVLALTDRLCEGLQARGHTLLSPRGPGISSGIVTFVPRGGDALAAGKELGRRGIVITPRNTGIRVSPHGHNTTDDIDALLEALDAIVP